MIFIGITEDEIQWKKIYFKGKPTNYSISDIGLVRNDKKMTYLKNKIHKQKYLTTDLSINGKQHRFYLHILIANAFIPNPNNLPEVNHKNGIKYDNSIENLEWVTRQENQQHAFQTGLNSHKMVDYSRIDAKTIENICKEIESNKYSIAKIAKRNNVGRATVSNILYGERHTDISYKYDFSNYIIRMNQHSKNNIISNSKYSNKEIHEVCKLLDSGKYTLKEISNMTRLSYQNIRNIYYGTNWKHISCHYNFLKNKESHPLYDQRKQKVVEICELLDKGYNSNQVGEMLDVNPSKVRKILAGRNWLDISKEYNFIKNAGKRRGQKVIK